MTNPEGRQGWWRGWLIHALAGAAMGACASLAPEQLPGLGRPLSHPLELVLGLSVAFFVGHTLESSWLGVVDQEVVPMAALLVLAGVMVGRGAPWPLLLVPLWVAQGLFEAHHLAKSLWSKRWRPGVATAVPFTAVTCFGVFPLWHDAVLGARGAFFFGFYGALLATVLAFYIEERRWHPHPEAP